MSIFVVVRDEHARLRGLLPLRELEWAHAVLGINNDLETEAKFHTKCNRIARCCPATAVVHEIDVTTELQGAQLRSAFARARNFCAGV